MRKAFKYRHVNEITGAFVIIVVVLLLGGVFLGERSQHWLARKYTFDLRLPEKGTSGLARGNSVFILGIDVGSVDDISVAEDGRMKARVRIRSDFRRFVRADSLASIRKTFGVAGDSFVEISKGVGPPLPEKEPAIACLSSDELPGMMEKLLDELRQETVPLLRKGSEALDAWTMLATNLNQTQAELGQVVARLDQVAAGLEQGRGTAGKLLTDSTLADDLQQLVAEARQMIAQGSNSLLKAGAAMDNLQQGTARLPEIGDAIAAEIKDLPGLVIQTQQTLHELERLVEALQRHWLVRKNVMPENVSGERISPTRVQGGQP